MNNKKINKWKNAWDNAPIDPLSTTPTEKQFDKCLHVLKVYLGANGPLSNALNRFFFFHWNFHHSKAVEKTLAEFDSPECEAQNFPELLTVENVLSCLRFNLFGSLLNKDGDLYSLLIAVQNKTGLEMMTIPRDQFQEALANQQVTDDDIRLMLS